MQHLSTKINIFVSSCDEFSDLWKPFEQFFFHYWPDCPFPVFLSSVSIRYSSPYMQQILVGNRLSWGDGVLKALKILQEINPAKYSLFLLDDYFLNEAVDLSTIEDCINTLDKMRGNYLRLIPKPPPNKPLSHCRLIGEIKKKTPYRLSLQASIWKSETLINLLTPTDTPWDLELLGSIRSNTYDGFYCTYQPVLGYINGVERGKWTSDSINLFAKHGLKIDTNKIPAHIASKQAPGFFQTVLGLIKNNIPLRQRLLFRTFIARIFNQHIK